MDEGRVNLGVETSRTHAEGVCRGALPRLRGRGDQGDGLQTIANLSALYVRLEVRMVINLAAAGTASLSPRLPDDRAQRAQGKTSPIPFDHHGLASEAALHGGLLQDISGPSDHSLLFPR